MTTFFALLLLASIVGLCVGLVSPTAISKILRRQVSRKQVAAIFGGLSLFSFVMVGVFAPSVPKENGATIAVQNTAPTSTAPVEVTPTSTEVQAEPEPKTTNAATPSTTTFLVTHVVDGDTFDVDMNGKTERLRMIGVDTPETVDPRKPVQCFGKEASAKTKELLTGKRVTLEADPSQGERDKYDRLLRYAFLPDGRNLALVLIQEGYAHEYTYNTPYKYQQMFKDAERAAREGKKGLWADDACAGFAQPVTSPSPAPTTPSPSTPTPAPQPSTPPAGTNEPPVKKATSSGKCHAKGTTYYNQTKNYTAYDTIQACLDSGGTLPK
ncbi:MAG: thermonuclease family protein [Patescibacteria group bacterium]